MKNVKGMLVAVMCSVMLGGMAVAAPQPARECKNNDCGTFQVGLYRVKDSLSMRLMMEKKAGERVSVRLMNQKGQVLHEEMVNKKQQKYACNFDFSTIRDGRYTLEISNGTERIKKDINLTTMDIVETPSRTLVAVN